jgi:hypothetical protein
MYTYLSITGYLPAITRQHIIHEYITTASELLTLLTLLTWTPQTAYRSDELEQ